MELMTKFNTMKIVNKFNSDYYYLFENGAYNSAEMFWHSDKYRVFKNDTEVFQSTNYLKFVGVHHSKINA